MIEGLHRRRSHNPNSKPEIFRFNPRKVQAGTYIYISHTSSIETSQNKRKKSTKKLHTDTSLPQVLVKRIVWLADLEEAISSYPELELIHPHTTQIYAHKSKQHTTQARNKEREREVQYTTNQHGGSKRV